ncbi:MAG: FKBP-type peptidyl-prolyl cis-trans isomerase, partial [Spirochaetales bacterium]|nr:FKBP-type peptidyl-prolyl cis-trans isomerase [Spirochaetales bacterium]
LDQGSDVTFTLGSLIPGFIEVATKMQVGEAVTAYIPPSLGYGENGTENIEPNSLLIFDIELKEIVK